MTSLTVSESGWGDAIIEGFLEKHLRPFGKSKLWCAIRGPYFSCQKGTKRSCPGEQIKLTDIQMVRVNNDRTGNQFEVQIKNKTITFSAVSSDDCARWVRVMQEAMMSEFDSLSSAPATKDAYDTCTPDRSLSLASTKSDSDAGYDEINVVGSIATQENNAICGRDTVSHDSIADAYEKITFVEDSSKDDRESASSSFLSTQHVGEQGGDCTSASPVQQDEAENLDNYGYATVNKISTLTATAAEDNKAETCEMDAEHADMEESEGSKRDLESDEEVYDDAFSSIPNRFSPVPMIPHCLTPTDWTTLSQMKEYLNNNPRLCRPSYCGMSNEKDPVAQLKQLLGNIQ